MGWDILDALSGPRCLNGDDLVDHGTGFVCEWLRAGNSDSKSRLVLILSFSGRRGCSSRSFMPNTVRGDGLLAGDIYLDTSLISDLFEGST